MGIVPQNAKVYGDEANFSKQGDAFTALMFSFILRKVKGLASRVLMLAKPS